MGINNVDQLRTEVDSDILDAENESFGRFKGFVGEHKYYFLQIAMVLLMVNIATRTIINSKDIVVDHRQYLSTT
jgi:curli biogenesis system outer membrane secretion channel CsgG